MDSLAIVAAWRGLTEEQRRILGGPGSGPHKAGDVVRFNGNAASGSVSGSMDVTVINPHSNADKVTSTKVEGKRTRQYEGANVHIPTATVEMDRSKRGLAPLRFEAYHHTLQSIKGNA